MSLSSKEGRTSIQTRISVLSPLSADFWVTATGHLTQASLITLPEPHTYSSATPKLGTLQEKQSYLFGLQLNISYVPPYFTLLFQSQMMSVTAHSNCARGLSEQMG